MLRAVTDPLTPTSAARAAKAISRADPDMARFIDVVGPFSPRPASCWKAIERTSAEK
jgi:hypothetical protein